MAATISASPVPRRAAATAALEWALAHPRAQRLTAGSAGPHVVLGAAIAGWVVLFGTHLVWRQDRFGTFDHDLGIWDQAVWLLSRGHDLITVRGLNVFGFHATPALYLFVPLYWLGAGPNALNVAMAAVLALGSVAVFRAARHHLGNEWHSLVLALAFLVNFAGQWMVWETFHPEVFAVTTLLFAYLAAVEGRWRAYAAWIVASLLWKEDVALAVLMLGALLAVRGRRTVGSRFAEDGPARTRLAGLATIAGAVLWFVVATRLLIPAFSSGGNFTEALFGDLGSTPGQIARTALSDPSIVAAHLDKSQPLSYVYELTASFGFTPLLSPLALLVGLPQLLINLLAVYDFFWTTKVHYAALPLFATAVASVEGVARARRVGVRRFLLGAVAVGAFFTAVSWGISPVSPEYHKGFWPLSPDRARLDELQAAVDLVGPDDGVSAVYNLVPHLTHRERAYTFPNPWMPSNWGVDGENRPDPAGARWLVIDPSMIASHERPMLAAVLQNPDQLLDPARPPTADPVTAAVREGRVAELVNRAKWEVVTDRPDLLILRRVGAESP